MAFVIFSKTNIKKYKINIKKYKNIVKNNIFLCVALRNLHFYMIFIAINEGETLKLCFIKNK
jgi:hypothetical protein